MTQSPLWGRHSSTQSAPPWVTSLPWCPHSWPASSILWADVGFTWQISWPHVLHVLTWYHKPQPPPSRGSMVVRWYVITFHLLSISSTWTSWHFKIIWRVFLCKLNDLELNCPSSLSWLRLHSSERECKKIESVYFTKIFLNLYRYSVLNNHI